MAETMIWLGIPGEHEDSYDIVWDPTNPSRVVIFSTLEDIRQEMSVHEAHRLPWWTLELVESIGAAQEKLTVNG